MSKRKQYATGFKWGKREHRAESWMTKFLLLAVIGVTISLLLDWDLFRAIILGGLVIVLILRLLTAFAHNREKYWMDTLRFKRRH